MSTINITQKLSIFHLCLLLICINFIHGVGDGVAPNPKKNKTDDIKIALVYYSYFERRTTYIPDENIQENLKRCTNYIKNASNENVNIIVFPKYGVTGDQDVIEKSAISQSLNLDEYVTYFAEYLYIQNKIIMNNSYTNFSKIFPDNAENMIAVIPMIGKIKYPNRTPYYYSYVLLNKSGIIDSFDREIDFQGKSLSGEEYLIFKVSNEVKALLSDKDIFGNASVLEEIFNKMDIHIVILVLTDLNSTEADFEKRMKLYVSKYKLNIYVSTMSKVLIETPEGPPTTMRANIESVIHQSIINYQSNINQFKFDSSSTQPVIDSKKQFNIVNTFQQNEPSDNVILNRRNEQQDNSLINWNFVLVIVVLVSFITLLTYKRNLFPFCRNLPNENQGAEV